MIPYSGNVIDALGLTILPSKLTKLIEKFFTNLVEERINNKSGRQKDFVNLMVDNEISESESSKSTKGLTRNEIIAQLFVFFFAGYETTATSVSATILYMLRNPHYIQKIREEADSLNGIV